MADVTQYEFSLAEVAQVLMKKEGVNEGRWMIGVNFAIGVASAGPDKEHVRPTALVSVDQLILTKTTETGPLTFDAAEVSSNEKR